MNTRIYRNLVDNEGNAITGQKLVAVKSGDSPSSSSSAVNSVEVKKTTGGVTYGTGSYYFDISEPGLWDIYVIQNSVPNMYQERQWVGGPVGGGVSGFTVYECVSPVPNDGSYYVAEFPALGLVPGAAISVTLPSIGAAYDASYGIQRDYSSGKIVVKISAGGLNQGSHMIYFTQGSVTYRTIYRVVDIASAFASPIYNFCKNPQFTLGSISNPTYWFNKSYFTPAPSGAPGKTALSMCSVVDLTTSPAFRLRILGTSAVDQSYYKIQPGDVIYHSQFVNIGEKLLRPRRFTISFDADVNGAGDMSLQISAVAISRDTSEVALLETIPNTVTISGRNSKSVDAPIGTNVIKIVFAFANRKAVALPASGSVDLHADITKVKLCAGIDAEWYV